MVAMLGWIMPEPLAIPVTVTVLPPTCARRLAPLATMSVVMIACAASLQWAGARSAWAAGSAGRILSTGSGSRITPVENGSTCSAPMPMIPATASQVRRARSRPSSPVPALALPVLITSARISALARCCLHRMTGAAQKRFCVNTPATRLPGASSISVMSRRPGFLMPAEAMPRRTPATGNREAGSGAVRLTGMTVDRNGKPPFYAGRGANEGGLQRASQQPVHHPAEPWSPWPHRVELDGPCQRRQRNQGKHREQHLRDELARGDHAEGHVEKARDVEQAGKCCKQKSRTEVHGAPINDECCIMAQQVLCHVMKLLSIQWGAFDRRARTVGRCKLNRQLLAPRRGSEPAQDFMRQRVKLRRRAKRSEEHTSELQSP